jgi:hypothetical protein
MTGYETVLEALESQGLVAPSWGDGVSAICPAHDDSKPSLSLSEGDDGKALLYCHAGCDIREVADALGLEMSALFSGSDTGAVVATYVYEDEEGVPLYRVVRLSPKGFYQQRYTGEGYESGLGDVRRVPYRLPDLVGLKPGDTVYIVEGEKDADNLRRAFDVASTTILGGAGKWRDEYAAPFSGLNVVVVVDKDDPGRAWGERLTLALTGHAASVQVVAPAVGKDITDHILAGFGLGELVVEGDGLDEFGPLDWTTYEAEETDWLVEPYIPKGGRVLAFGPAGSLKSLWAMWVAARLAKDGKKVAYFSLEMLPSDTAKRLKQLAPPPSNFMCFTKDFKLGSPGHTAKLIAGLRGYDLIVIDSWSAARAHAGRESNEAIAELDSEVFLPLMKTTGAAILAIDNTGHALLTESGKLKPDHARGASAKGDKMEVCLSFDRPFDSNNYRTRIRWTKMRLDYPMPKDVVIETPMDRIEFYQVDDGVRTDRPLWKGDVVEPENPVTSAPVVDSGATPTMDGTEEMTPEERRKLARLRDMFKAVEYEEPAPV